MNEEVIRAKTRSEIRSFVDDNATQYAEVAKLTPKQLDRIWELFSGEGWVIGYTTEENWSDAPWFFRWREEDAPFIYSSNLEGCFQVLIYPPDGTPSPEAQAKIDANIDAKERLKKKSLWRHKKKQNRRQKKRG